MDSIPKISIIIPIYNRAHLISRVLNTLCNQSEQDFEVIIVDDCSNDSIELRSVIDNYQIKINYIRHEVNMHGAAARNTGIKNAQGKFVAFLDSDDYWHEDKLKICLEKNIKANEIIYSQIRDRGVIHPVIPFDMKMPIDDYLIVNKGSMQTSSLFMHKKFALEIMFDASLKRFQDYDFIIRAGKCFGADFVFINKVLVEMGEEDIGFRISSSVNHLPAIDWLTKVSHILTPKSKAVFAFNRLINYATNNVSRREIIALFFKFGCYKYIQYLDMKVIAKFMLGKNQKLFRK